MKQCQTKTYHRDHLTQLYAALGWRTASQWDNTRLLEKLTDIPVIAPDESLPDNFLEDLLQDIIMDIQLGNKFQVVGFR